VGNCLRGKVDIRPKDVVHLKKKVPLKWGRGCYGHSSEQQNLERA